MHAVAGGAKFRLIRFRMNSRLQIRNARQECRRTFVDFAARQGQSEKVLTLTYGMSVLIHVKTRKV